VNLNDKVAVRMSPNLARGSQSPASDWLQPQQQQEGLARYVQVVRERIWLVVLAVVITTVAALIYVQTADEVYEAEADILVNPIPDESAELGGLGLLRESADPLRDVETAARLIESQPVAELAAERLGTGASADSLLEDVQAEPVAESNIVAVTAEGPTADEAANVANAFAEAAVDQRTQQLRERIDQTIPRLEAQIETLPEGDPSRADLERQVSQLQLLRAGEDPTLQQESPATPPTSPVSPRTKLSIAGGLLAGLILGIGGAFAFQALDPRLRREEQLRGSYRLPILARIPREPKAKRHRDQPFSPEELSPETLEGFHTLRATLGARRVDGRRLPSALVTSSAPSEGKTTTAINLAASLARAGGRVILIEGDLRRPTIGRTLGVRPKRGVVSVLTGEASLDEALITAPDQPPNLKLLLADHMGAGIPELLSLPIAQGLVDEAKREADHVIIDSPPLTEVADALALVPSVDAVLIVVMLGKSSLGRIHELSDLLAGNNVRPAGFAVLGADRPREGYYYQQVQRPGQRPSRQPRQGRRPPRKTPVAGTQSRRDG
jgi:Mrp family chromosome partitioning ATPase/capsular polysaccharide biosynthesis protein